MKKLGNLKIMIIAAGFSLSPWIAAHGQSDIKTPYTGKISCQQILQAGANNQTGYYEKKLNAETKWAFADYNRCKFNSNFTESKKLSADKRKNIEKLRVALERYFAAFYAMQTITAGGGNPFELDGLSAQSDVENLISKAVSIYSKPILPKPDLRKQAESNLANGEKRLPALTEIPAAKEFDWLDADSEDDAETIKDLQANYQKEANAMRESLQNFHALIKVLPDSLALLASELLDNIQP